MVGKREEIYSDCFTIRRHLIEHEFMDRTKGCQIYWVKENVK